MNVVDQIKTKVRSMDKGGGSIYLLQVLTIDCN